MNTHRLIFRVEGYKELGLGHIYNCYTLAEAMSEYECVFLISEKSGPGIAKLNELNMPYMMVKGREDIENAIRNFCPDIWVNDCLDTDEGYIAWLKERINRVVTIEDNGSGRNIADAVINAIYSGKTLVFGDDVVDRHIYSGWEYVCLRQEFQETFPNSFRKEVRNVIIMFGGTDPSNYNRLLYGIVQSIANKYKGISFSFITGIGYDNIDNGVVSIPEKNIYVYPNVPRVTEYMKNADIAISSQGRVVFELAAMGIPAIILSQNEREQTHTFAQMDHGFLNLGLKDITDELVGNTLDWLINTPQIRRNMYDLMIKVPLREGIGRVIKIITGD